ncbi:type II secretion system protein N [uncultured Sphingomonas sp.]|uniref:type II secretion system protein N n=1 Tax=uncultured Sphingomonas sp. TaxID=158754 RepID=UPI0035CB59F8
MRLQLDARARRWLQRLPVVNLYSLAELALMAVLAAQLARLFWAIVTPVDPLGEWRPAAVVIPASPVDTLTSFDPFFRLSGAQVGPAVVTSLQLKLFGIRIDDATGRGAAIVAGPDGLQRSVSVGEEVSPGVRLSAVAFDHITLDRGGASEDLFLDQSTQATPVVTGPPPTASGTAGPAGVPVANLRQEIGFIPRIDGGRLTGLVLRSQGTGSAFAQAGLQNGDVLTSIAGRPVTGPDDFDRIGRDFANGGNVPISVERGSQTLPLAITIAPPQ